MNTLLFRTADFEMLKFSLLKTTANFVCPRHCSGCKNLKKNNVNRKNNLGYGHFIEPLL